MLTSCDKCNGTGTFSCQECQGTGEIGGVCPECGGAGDLPPPPGAPANAMPEICPGCDGAGTLIEWCPSCGGSGRIDCGDCKGTGKVEIHTSKDDFDALELSTGESLDGNNESSTLPPVNCDCNCGNKNYSPLNFDFEAHPVYNSIFFKLHSSIGESYRAIYILDMLGLLGENWDYNWPDDRWAYADYEIIKCNDCGRWFLQHWG